YLASRNSQPVETRYLPKPWLFFDHTGEDVTEYEGSGALSVTYYDRLSTEISKSSLSDHSPILNDSSRSFTMLPCNNDLKDMTVTPISDDDSALLAYVILKEVAGLMKPIFYKDKDGAGTLFVEPSVTERTVEEWEDWVTQTPVPEPGWEKPDW